MIAKLRTDDYFDSHPTPEDIILVVEVANWSLSFVGEASRNENRETKLALYAAAGINEYWIVNLIDDRLEIYRQPEGIIYTNNQILTPPRSVPLPIFPELTLAIATIFLSPQSN